MNQFFDLQGRGIDRTHVYLIPCTFGTFKKTYLLSDVTLKGITYWSFHFCIFAFLAVRSTISMITSSFWVTYLSPGNSYLYFFNSGLSEIELITQKSRNFRLSSSTIYACRLSGHQRALEGTSPFSPASSSRAYENQGLRP